MIELKIIKQGLSLDEFFDKFGFTKESLLDEIKKCLRMGVIYTHSGKVFHADEVFSIALLEIYRQKLNKELRKELYPSFKIIRGRDFSDNVKGLRIDVDNSVFDHHFPKEQAAFRENGVQYASVGLLWSVIGKELVHTNYCEIFDKQIFESLDAFDNGQEGFTSQYSNIISSFNPQWNEDNLILETQMQKAVDFAIIILERKIAELNAIDLAKTEVIKSYEKTTDKRIVILSKCMNWEEVLVPTEALFVIWESEKQWCVQAVPKEINSFELKNGFKNDWRGLRNQELKEKSKLDLIFCHSTGFYLVAETKEAAIEACKQSFK